MTNAVIAVAATGNPYSQYVISGLYSGHSSTCFYYHSSTLMAGNAGKGRHGNDAIEDGEVRMAYSRRFILDQDFTGFGTFQIQFLDDKWFSVFV
jgi:hypothetical protein